MAICGLSTAPGITKAMGWAGRIWGAHDRCRRRRRRFVTKQTASSRPQTRHCALCHKRGWFSGQGVGDRRQRGGSPAPNYAPGIKSGGVAGPRPVPLFHKKAVPSLGGHPLRAGGLLGNRRQDGRRRRQASRRHLLRRRRSTCCRRYALFQYCLFSWSLVFFTLQIRPYTNRIQPFPNHIQPLTNHI